MNLTTNIHNDVTVLTLDGRFDAHEAPAVVSALNGSLQTASVVVNLSGVNFIDSTALSTLVQGMKHCRERSGDLVLSNLQQPVRVIFELTKLDRAFVIYGSQEDALAAIAK